MPLVVSSKVLIMITQKKNKLLFFILDWWKCLCEHICTCENVVVVYLQAFRTKLCYESQTYTGCFNNNFDKDQNKMIKKWLTLSFQFSVFLHLVCFTDFCLRFNFFFAFATGIVLKILPEKFALGNLHVGSQNCLKLIFSTAVLSVCLCMWL